MFIGNECYIDGNAGLSAIFWRNHCCDRCTFACAVAFFIYPYLRTLPPGCQLYSDFKDPFAQLMNCHIPIFKHFLFLLHFCNCFGQNLRLTRMLIIMDVSTWTLWPTFSHFWHPYTVAHRRRITDDECQWGVMSLAIKKMDHYTQLALAGKVSGSSIANACAIKYEHRQGLSFVGISKGGAKLHASAAGSRVKLSSRLQRLGDLILQTCLVLL